MSGVECFAARTTDESLLKVSSSGGVFTELARVVLSEGGVVFGAGWQKNPLRVVHRWTEDESGLEDLRGSKYSVSDMSGVYAPLKRFLEDGRQVLFVGTPCQTAAIRKTFGGSPNLILCALICMANAERSMLDLYLRELEQERGSRVRSIRFRDNSDGWHFSKMTITFADGKPPMSESLYRNAYFRALEIHPRRVCCACPFRSGRGGADLIIGDLWKIEQALPAWHDWKGTNAIIVCTERGREVFDRARLRREQIEYGRILAGNPYLERQYAPNARQYRRFDRVYRRMGIRKAVRYAEGPWLYKTFFRLIRALSRRLNLKKCV